MKELEIIRAQFLADDIDEEDREDNERILQEWENSLIQNTAFVEWRNHEITREIVQKIKTQYKEFAVSLYSNRSLTDTQRQSLWAKQDACMFILSLTEKNAKEEIEHIQKEIKAAISVT